MWRCVWHPHTIQSYNLISHKPLSAGQNIYLRDKCHDHRNDRCWEESDLQVIFSNIARFNSNFLFLIHPHFVHNLDCKHNLKWSSIARVVCPINKGRTKSYKLERVLFKTLESFPSALFPKIWNSIELELKETKSAKSFKRKVAKIYLDSYANYIYKEKNCVSCG